MCVSEKETGTEGLRNLTMANSNLNNLFFIVYLLFLLGIINFVYFDNFHLALFQALAEKYFALVKISSYKML